MSLVLATVLCGRAIAIDPPLTTRRAAVLQRDAQSDTWAGVDALGRVLPGIAECGPAKPGKYVGIFYFLWMEDRLHNQVFDLSKLVAENAVNPHLGKPGVFHWWGEPHLGYYTSNDEFVIRRHAQMLSDAGVDVIICDVTNALTYDDTVATLLKTYVMMREEGNRTPQVAFIAHAKSARTVQHLYEVIYAKQVHPELWFKWKGKPLLLAPTDGLSDEVRQFFTIRDSWAWTRGQPWFGNGKDRWPWLDHTPQQPGWHESPDKPEAISVTVAEHPVNNIGRSFHAGREPMPAEAHPEQGSYFAEQWERALKVNPEFIFVTGWNEWIAQRFIKEPGKGANTMIGQKLAPGDSFFVDEYSQEYSRDIEPMRGGHGDNYYYQMVANIRRFKGVAALPRSSPPVTIPANGDMTAWARIQPEYKDDLFDTITRNHRGYGNALTYTNATGQNDFDLLKVTHDASHIYLYARTRDPITPPTDDRWMNLLLSTSTDPKAGWQGFQFVVNRKQNSDGTCSIERFAGKHAQDWKWEAVGAAALVVKGNNLQLSIPRKLIGMESAAGRLQFRFKWTDNVPPGDALEFLDKGDVAPNGRFSYQYKE